MSLIHIFRRQQQFSMIQQMDKFGESPERIQNTGAKADPPFAYGSAIWLSAAGSRRLPGKRNGCAGLRLLYRLLSYCCLRQSALFL